MKLVITALEEVYGLFVDDGLYAFEIVAWVVVAALLLPRLPIGGSWRGPLLFVGLSVLLLAEIGRSAR